MVVDGMFGLGDNIYQRAFVREIPEAVYLRTAWPQIYRDLPHVFPVRVDTHLRTQAKNVAAQAGGWYDAPRLPARKIRYGAAELHRASILGAMAACFQVAPRVFDLPEFDRLSVGAPYAVVRPATVRAEWMNPARNPRAEYICAAADALRARGFKVVSVADLVCGVEWADELPACDFAYNHGELNFEQLMGLIQGAAVVVGGVGWIVPAAIAAGVPLVTILGGQGDHNAPQKITGAPMRLERARWIFPDRYCMCAKKLHACDKRITDFESKFEKAIDSLCLTRPLAKI